jgi:hypothetical protein
MNPLCSGDYDSLCIHHIDYKKTNCSPRNLICVCISCNTRANYNREFWQEHYTNIINNLYK